jgi:hypothetical protein
MIKINSYQELTDGIDGKLKPGCYCLKKGMKKAIVLFPILKMPAGILRVLCCLQPM